MDDSGARRFRESEPPVSNAILQYGDFGAAQARVNMNTAGRVGDNPTTLALQAPKHPLQYYIDDDDAKLASILNRHRFPTNPHQSVTQVRNRFHWWESRQMTRFPAPRMNRGWSMSVQPETLFVRPQNVLK